MVGSPSHSGYEWVDKGVREYFSKYQLSSSIRKFAAAYAILDEDSPNEAVSLDQVGRANNACDRQGGYSDKGLTPTKDGGTCLRRLSMFRKEVH